jgi:radical SAM protein with 4Fe4S-binding SPASM domain
MRPQRTSEKYRSVRTIPPAQSFPPHAHRSSSFWYNKKIMGEEGTSPEKTLLKAVFESRGWEMYAKRVDILSSPDPRDWELVDFPVEIAAELTNYCNLKCVMCPVPAMRRRRGFMDETLFSRIVSGVSEESGFLFLPQGFGEPFLHALWSRFIDLAGSLLLRPIVVLTNGMLLCGEKMPSLMKNCHIVVVTVDGSTAETYESVRINGKLSTVTRNLEEFLQVRGRSAAPHLIVRMIRMRDTQKDVEAFRAFWSGKIGKGDIIQISDCIDWAGTVPYRGVTENRGLEKRQPCRMLWKNLTVYHDGRVSPCCYDAEGDLTIGNVADQSLRDLWSGRPLRDLRDLHLAHHFDRIPICSRCQHWL